MLNTNLERELNALVESFLRDHGLLADDDTFIVSVAVEKKPRVEVRVTDNRPHPVDTLLARVVEGMPHRHQSRARKLIQAGRLTTENLIDLNPDDRIYHGIGDHTFTNFAKQLKKQGVMHPWMNRYYSARQS